MAKVQAPLKEAELSLVEQWVEAIVPGSKATAKVSSTNDQEIEVDVFICGPPSVENDRLSA